MCIINRSIKRAHYNKNNIASQYNITYEQYLDQVERHECTVFSSVVPFGLQYLANELYGLVDFRFYDPDVTGNLFGLNMVSVDALTTVKENGEPVVFISTKMMRVSERDGIRLMAHELTHVNQILDGYLTFDGYKTYWCGELVTLETYPDLDSNLAYQIANIEYEREAYCAQFDGVNHDIDAQCFPKAHAALHRALAA